MELKDITGLEPLTEATRDVVEKSFDGLNSFLRTVFKPGLQELGYLIKDEVRYWRLCNVLRVLDKAKGKLEFVNDGFQLLANSRVGLSIIEECSMVDDDELQDMWAGLFASSCTPDGKDDSNLIFVDLLKRISIVEARILKYGCEHCKKIICPNGLIIGKKITINLDDLKRITSVADVYRLDRELDHMRSLSLLEEGGFYSDDIALEADISPSALALNLYYKVSAVNISEKDFWKDSVEES